MADVHHEGEDEKSTLPTGTESVDELNKAIAEMFPDDNAAEAQKQFLEQVGKIEGRTYNSIEDYTKTVIERNKAVNKFYSDEGRRKKEEEEGSKPKTTPLTAADRYAEKLLTIENKEASLVIDELRQIAKDNKIDVMEAWDKFSWVRKEAAARAEEAAEKEKNGGKILHTGQKISGTGGGSVELSEADRKLLSRVPGRLEKWEKEHSK